MNHIREPHFQVSTSTPDDIAYKLQGFFQDIYEFHTKYSTEANEQNPQKVNFQTLSKPSEASVISGYCSRTNSSISDVSVSSTTCTHHQDCDTGKPPPNIIITDEQLKAINVYFSSLSTSVVVCMTPSKLYELDNIYELGLHETGNKSLGWNQFCEGILFVQFEKSGNVVKTNLCLVNPDNCRLFSKIPLTRDSKLNSIRPCLRYLMTSDETGLTKVYGLYFADDLKANEFADKLYSIFDCLNENNETYQRRMSNALNDSKLITWLQSRNVVDRSSRSLANFFKHKSKSSEQIKPVISDPSEFEQTLHVPLEEHITQ